jgi:hypothetical protein
VLSVHGGIAIYSLLLTDADARAYQARGGLFDQRLTAV